MEVLGERGFFDAISISCRYGGLLLVQQLLAMRVQVQSRSYAWLWERRMQAFVVKWIIEGEMSVEAEDVAAAEIVAQQSLVAVLSDETRWPADLGAKGIQGTAEKVD